MKVTKTSFEGLLIFEPSVYSDKRGHFYESWKEIDYKSYGIQESFIQDNFSISYKNVLRGLHYQKDQGQLITVVSGAIFDVLVDIRPYSPTFKKHFSIQLSGENIKQLYMSPGFAHGFYVISDMVIINYKCTQYYNPSVEGGIIWNDSTLEIEWPCSNPIVSKKDASFLLFNDSVNVKN